MNTTLNNSLMVKKPLLTPSTSNSNQNKANNTTTLQFINKGKSINNSLNQLAFLGMSHIKKVNLSFQNDNEINDYCKYLSNYDNAVKLVNNPDKLAKFFLKIENTQSVQANDIANNNFKKAMVQKATKELKELETKKILTPEEQEKQQGLNELIEIFSTQSPDNSPKSVAFKGNNISIGISTQNVPKEFKNITPLQYGLCHAIIHSTMANCGTISFIAGEGAAIGADTWFLRGSQTAMFASLALILNVPPIASSVYASKEMLSGAAIGTGVAKALISWLGLGVHGGSAGTLSAPATAGVRSVNAALSGAITEKMGWGYVKSVEKGKMNIKDQLIDAAVTMAVPKVADVAVEGVTEQLAHNLFKSMSKENVETLGRMAECLNHFHGDTISKAFASSLISRFSENALKGNKETLIEALGNSCITALAYDLSKVGIESIDTQSMQKVEKAAQEIRQAINSMPEVYKDFNKLSEISLKQLSSYTTDVNLSKEQIDALTEYSSKFAEKNLPKINHFIAKKKKAI